MHFTTFTNYTFAMNPSVSSLTGGITLDVWRSFPVAFSSEQGQWLSLGLCVMGFGLLLKFICGSQQKKESHSIKKKRFLILYAVAINQS